MSSAETPDNSGDAEPIDAEFVPAEPEKSGPGLGAMLLGAGKIAAFVLVAGAAGAGGAYLLDSLRPQTETAEALPPELESRLRSLENTVSGLAGLEARFVALEDRATTELVPAEALRTFDADIRQLREDFEALAARPATAGSDMPADGAVAALEARLEEIRAEAARALEAAQRASEAASGAGPAQAVDLAPLERGQTALDDRLARLEARLDDETSTLDRQTRDALESQSRQTGDALDTLETRLAARITALEQGLADQERSASGDSAAVQRLAGRVMAFTALRDAAALSAPFEAERAALARLWPGERALAGLQPIARSGAPTLDDLRESLPVREIIAASGEARSFLGLFEVRPAGTGPDSALALLRQGEARLERGDLAGAVEAVSRLEGNALGAAESWLTRARTRLTLDDTLARLRADLASQIEAEG